MAEADEYNKRGPRRGWSKTGTLAIRSASNPNTDANVIQLQVDFQEPNTRYYTVQFFVSPPTVPLDLGTDPGVAIRAQAEIIWTVAGNAVRRLISVANGSSISGLGRHVAVYVKDDSINTSGVPNRTYDVGILIAPGTRPTFGAAQPPIFMPRDEIVIGGPATPPPYTFGPGDTAILPIPENAGVNSVMLGLRPTVTLPAIFQPDQVSIEFLGETGGVWLAADGTICNKFYPIPAGATRIAISNSWAENIEITPVYGIEG